MANRWSSTMVLLTACLLSSQVLAVGLETDQPFKPQPAEARADFANTEKHSEMSQEERAKVSAVLDRFEAIFEAHPNVRALQPNQLAGARNDQEFVTGI